LVDVSFWADDVAAAAWCAQFLGVEAYLTRPGPGGRLAYAEFRIGDYQAELGIIDRSYGPPGAAGGPGGAVTYWHADDLAGTVERLLSMGAAVYQPVTPRGRGSSPPLWPARSARGRSELTHMTAARAA
jgi:hypothetical protein